MTIVAQDTKVFCVPCMAKGRPIILFERVQNVVFIRVHKRQYDFVAGLGGALRAQCPSCDHSITIRLDNGSGIL